MNSTIGILRSVPIFLLFGLNACSDGPFGGVPQAPTQALEKFVLTETQRGVTQWILRAQEAILQDAGGAELTTPHVEIFKDGKPATQVDSREGTYDDKTRNLHLRGDVVVVSKDEDSSEKTTLKTQALDYLDSEKHFKTDLPVTITRPGEIMHGRGLIANHDLSEIQVLHQEAVFQ